MSKKSAKLQPRPTKADPDAALVNRVYSQLRIPGSRDAQRFADRVKAELPEETWRRWDDLRNDGQKPEFYELSHADVHTSMLLSAGLRSDLARQELAWLLPRLRRDVAGRADPVIVEVGCGSGVASAIVSLALGVRVVATDVCEPAVRVAAEVARALGADVDARVAAADDLPSALDGRQADAVFLFSTLRHIQDHEHGDTMPQTFSTLRVFEHRLAHPHPTATLAALAGVLKPDGVLYYTDPSCPDRLVEVEACLATLGRHLALDDRRTITGHVIGKEERHDAVAARPGARVPTATDFLTLLSGPPQPLRPGLKLEGAAAERTRLASPLLATVRACELEWPDGRVRRSEMFEGPGFVGTYHADPDGYRDLQVYPPSHRAKTLSDFDTPLDPSHGIRERPLVVGALNW